MKTITFTLRPSGLGSLFLWPLALFAAPPELRESDHRAVISWQGDAIAELQDFRRLRFRASGDNERWVGTRLSKMDLCWDYGGVNDYVYRTHRFESNDRGFILEIDADKPSVHGHVRTRLEGELIPDRGFKFVLSSRLSASQNAWREQAGVRGGDPDRPLRLEMLDYHVNRISQADIFAPGATPGMTEIYDAFVLSDEGTRWRQVPKIPLPSITRVGADSFPTETWPCRGDIGQRLGFLDRREGGWEMRLVDASAPLQFTMCWMYYDVHHYLEGGIPARVPGQDRFEARYALEFSPRSPAEARRILDSAEPIEWRSRPEYQLPVFDRYNTFDRLISKNSEYPWFATDARCSVDTAVGYDDHASGRIQNTESNQKSAWYAWTWGPAFDQHAPLSGTYRFSAMVKTRNCTTPVRLAVVEFLHDLWPNPDGTLVSPKNRMWLALEDRRDRWHYSSQSVSGSSDWTRLSIDLRIDNDQFKPNKPESARRGVVLQYHGKGTVWFDNVRIERLE